MGLPLKKMSDGKKLLAKNFALLRAERNHSLEMISSKALLDIKIVINIAEGKANPTLKDIVKLASALDTPLESLLSAKLSVKNKSKK